MASPLAVRSPSTLRTTSASPASSNGFLEVGGDDFLGVGIGGVAGYSELFRHPQAEQPVAARFGLELLLLVEGEFLLETFLALVECGHG